MSPEEFQQTVRSLDLLFSDGVAVYARPSFGTIPKGSVDSDGNRYIFSGEWLEDGDSDDVILGTVVVDPENGIYEMKEG
ncbi:MAG: hypothetical protein J0M04_10045 [Verrucomicrobia bacterium]|nr:hypothetical protein [Verrucomicrobiota bacterium]